MYENRTSSGRVSNKDKKGEVESDHKLPELGFEDDSECFGSVGEDWRALPFGSRAFLIRKLD